VLAAAIFAWKKLLAAIDTIKDVEQFLFSYML
jgi:hypothetical protein